MTARNAEKSILRRICQVWFKLTKEEQQRHMEQKLWKQRRVGKPHPSNGVCQQRLPAARWPVKEDSARWGGAQVLVYLGVTHVDEHLADFLEGMDRKDIFLGPRGEWKETASSFSEFEAKAEAQLWCLMGLWPETLHAPSSPAVIPSTSKPRRHDAW